MFMRFFVDDDSLGWVRPSLPVDRVMGIPIAQ